MMWRVLLVLGWIAMLAWGGVGCPGSTAEKADVDGLVGDSSPHEAHIDAPTAEALPEALPEVRPEPITDATCTNVQLLNHTLWKPVERANDPYKALAPPGQPCNDVAYKLEDGVIEVETGICSFLTVSQALSMSLKKGDKMKITFWHLALTASSSAEGYVSIAIGDKAIYVKKIPIPADPAVYEETFVLDQDYTSGQLLYFHIHNHGSNTWKLLSLDRLCPGN